MTVVVAGDVGGTNLRLALVELPAAGPARVRAREQVPVREHEGLVAPLAAFVQRHAPGERPPVGLGVAAPVAGRTALMTGVNMPWRVDADALEREAPVGRVTLVNDFYAAAMGLPLLGPGDVHALGGGVAAAGEALAILGAGTGLGQAFVLRGPGGARVVPSEGGHRDFGPRTPLQDRLLAWLRRAHGRVSTERVLSGPGLVALYRFLVAEEKHPPAPPVEAALAAGGEAAPRIVAAALDGVPHVTCALALDTFLDVYGAEAANVALTAIARGGVFVAGGIAPAVLVRAGPGARFRRAFEDGGRFRELLAGIPTLVVTTPDLGLLGAAAAAAPSA